MTYSTRITLISRLKNRTDEQAWLEFDKTYRPYIAGILIRMEFTNHDIQDIQQNVMLKAWDKLSEFHYDKSKGKFRHWIASITINTAKNLIRKNSRLSNAIKDKETLLERYLKQTDSPELEEIIQNEWEYFVTQKAWGNIEGTLSKLVIQCFEKVTSGLPVKQIAKDLSIQENTVYVYNKRVKNALCCEIARLEEELN